MPRFVRALPCARHWLSTCILLALGGALPHAARAQDGPYENFLVGEHALGLAGAFVAVADDPSASFHNPAGVGAIEHNMASGSVFAFGLRSRSLELGYSTPLGETHLEYDAAPSLAPFLGAVLKLGSRGRDGVAAHSLGITLLTPYRDDYRFVAQLEADDPDLDVPGVDRLEVHHEDTAQWYGLTYGLRVQRGLAFGLSAFLATRELGHGETEIRIREGVLADFPQGANESRNASANASAEHVVLRLGTLLNVSPKVRLGLMFQPPGIQLGARATYERLTADFGPTESAFDTTTGESRTHLPIPWEVRAGVGWRNSPQALLTFDVSVLGPVGSASDPQPIVARDSAGVPAGLFLPEIAYRQFCVRTAIGFELAPVEAVPIRGGVLVERSSAPEVPLTSTVFSRERVHTLGGALSVGLRTRTYDISVGVTGLYGVGEGLGLVRGAADEPPSYRATDIRETTLLVFVTGARQAVQRLVETVTSDSPKNKPKPKR